MEELFAQRLSELIKNSNYILADMEEAVGKKGATISRYASGEIKGVKRQTIVKLANFFGVSPAWLAGLSDEKYNLKTDDLLKKIGAISLSNTDTVTIPVLGIVKAGYDYLAEGNWTGIINVEKSLVGDGSEYFALAVKGDSMAPVFIEGDIVIVHKQNDCENNEIAIVIVNDDEGTIKKVRKTDAGIILQPLNPAYAPTIYSNDEIKSIPIIIAGIVKQLKRDF